MSAGAEAAPQGGGRPYPSPGWPSPSRLAQVEQQERPTARLLTFSALALYGVLRWTTLLSPAPGLRLFGLLALAVLVAGAGPKLASRTRALAIVAAICSVLVMLAISGIPVGWLVHARVARIADGISQGVTAIPGVLVPYVGSFNWVKIVIIGGAGALLLDAALLLAFAPRTLGDLRRAAAALPLIALAVVPSTLARPALPWVQGLILFALLAAFMWSERMTSRHAAGAVALAAVAGAAAVIVAPNLEQGHPWFNYQATFVGLEEKNIDTFNWSQSYGPLYWPDHGRTVLDIKAPRAADWKTENLDTFNGVAWAQEPVPGSRLPLPSPGHLARWTQTLQVTIRSMKTSQVVAAGLASEPQDLGQAVKPGVSPGTWVTNSPLEPGDTYKVTAYSPPLDPPGLQKFGADYLDAYPAEVFSAELTIGLPRTGLAFGAPPQVQFARFHSGQAPQALAGPPGTSGEQLLESSPYARAYELATRLARSSATPYAFVRKVMRYLSPANGFTYDQSPSPTAYPLEQFLFVTKLGYCQQFAGAMALLLRMGGIPARVVTGFETGTYDASSKQFKVTDTDAHAWVEVWFPSYGWVGFDPTPPTTSATDASALLAARGASGGASQIATPRVGSAVSSSTGASSGSGTVWLVVGLLAAAVVAVGLLVILIRARRRGPLTGEQLVAELERALARSGRPLARDATLASLERRFRGNREAERYVRLLRLVRYAGAAELPTLRGRRAVRGELAEGLGARGWLRAWWALPPRLVN